MKDFDDLEPKSLKVAEERNNIEYKIHMAIKDHVEKCFYPRNPNLKLIHIPNQTKNAQEGYFKKLMGAHPGFSDFLAGWPHNTGVLEVKKPGGYLAPEQNKFISWADRIGWHTGIARSVKEAHNVLKSWGLIAAYESTIEPDLRTNDQKRKDAFDFYKPTN